MQQYEYINHNKATKCYKIKTHDWDDLMNFLEYGLRHKNSVSKVQRMVAKCLLKIEIWKADRYEDRLNKKHIPVPDDPDGTDALLRAIRDQIERQGLG